MNIQLKYGSTTAEIRQKGAQMVSFRGSDGREVIWQADPAVWPNYAPVLFPVCGMPKDEKVIIHGVTYPMAKHGFSRNPVYTIARVGDDFVDLVLTPTEESRPQYPFEFEFHVVYTLRENGFRTDFIVENKSNAVMPFCVGGHPGFIVPMEEGAAYTDYQLVFPQRETGRNLLVPGGKLVDGEEILPLIDGRILPLSHSLFDDRDALVLPECTAAAWIWSTGSPARASASAIRRWRYWPSGPCRRRTAIMSAWNPGTACPVRSQKAAGLRISPM